MHAHDVAGSARALPLLEVTRATSDSEAMEAIRTLGSLNGAMVGVVRFRGLTPWERHPGGDELLYVIAGGVDVTVLDGDAVRVAAVGAGQLCVVPRGLWHRQRAADDTALLFVTDAETTATSWADDPRVAEG